MRKIDPTLVPQDLTAQEIVDVDINVITTDNPETDEEILESVRSDKDEETNGDDSLEIMEVFDEPIDKPTQNKNGNALETLQNLCLFNFSYLELFHHWHPLSRTPVISNFRYLELFGRSLQGSR